MHKLGNGLLYFLAIGVAVYAAVVYGLLPLGVAVHPLMKSTFQSHPIGIYTHVFGAILALVLGPFQFSQRLRRKFIGLHRWSGRIYLGVGVLVGGLAGLYMSQFAFGGLAARLGFGLLAACWLYSGARAYLAIRRGETLNHRKWMVRNYALTFAAVTLRLYLPLTLASGVAFEIAYPWIAWLCWVPNLILAEWLFNTSSRTQFAS